MIRTVAWLGAAASIGTELAIAAAYLLIPQRMLAGVTIWMHREHLHVLPSAAWMLALLGFSLLSALFIAVAMWQPRHPLLALYARLRRAPTSGASLTLSSLFRERLLKMTFESFLDRVAVWGLQGVLKLGTTDKAAFEADIDKLILVAETDLDAAADKLIAAAAAQNAVFAAANTYFGPQIHDEVIAEIKALGDKGEAEVDALTALGTAMVTTEIATLQASIAADSATMKPAAMASLMEPEIHPAVALSAEDSETLGS